jgi:hypothetical protein
MTAHVEPPNQGYPKTYLIFACVGACTQAHHQNKYHNPKINQLGA